MNIKIDNAYVEITLIEHSLSPDFTLPGEMEGNMNNGFDGIRWNEL